MKRIIAFFLALFLIFGNVGVAFATSYNDVATPTDIEYVEIADDDFGYIEPELIHRQVYIDVLQEAVYYGDELILIAILVDFKPEDNPRFQWQYTDDETFEIWHNIDDATEQTYKFIVTKENADYWYRVVVTID